MRHISTVHTISKEPDVEKVQSDVEKVQSNVEKVQSDVEKVQSGGKNVQSDVEKVQTFNCPTCYKIFKQKRFYTRHMPTCKKVQSPLECARCHSVFETKSALSMHRKRCDGSPDVGESTSDNSSGSGSSVTNTTNIQAQTVIQTQNNVVNVAVSGDVNNTLVINNFGNENKEYIAIEFIRQCLNQGHHGIPPMIDKIYFDPEHPENHNITLESFKNRLVKVVKEKQWEFASLLNTVDSMISKASTFILTTLQQEILQLIASDATATETMANVQSIQNLEPQVKKRIREHTKGRLARRRDKIQSSAS